MKNRKGAVLLAFAVALSTSSMALARGEVGGEGRSGGYPIGSMSSSQYAGALAAKSNADSRYFSHGTGRNWWNNGVGGIGGYGYAQPWTPYNAYNNNGYNGSNATPGSLDGVAAYVPMPNSAGAGATPGSLDGVAAYVPIPVAPSEAAQPIVDMHQSGPSMSFQTETPPNNTVANFNATFNSNFSPSNGSNDVGDINSGIGRNFTRPQVRRGITANLPVNSSGYTQRMSDSTASQVNDALNVAQHLFESAKETGTLGSIDINDYQTRLNRLSEAASDFAKSSDKHGEDESLQLINQINKYSDDLRMRNN